jgi:hypothetical protein
MNKEEEGMVNEFISDNARLRLVKACQACARTGRAESRGVLLEIGIERWKDSEGNAPSCYDNVLTYVGSIGAGQHIPRELSVICSLHMF